MERKLIRKVINNIFVESQYVDTIMELADRKNPEPDIALTQEEKNEIIILLSQTDYLREYLSENGILV